MGQLVADLERALDQVNTLEQGLFGRRPGCACTDRTLCPEHSEIRLDLEDAAGSLQRALQRAKTLEKP